MDIRRCNWLLVAAPLVGLCLMLSGGRLQAQFLTTNGTRIVDANGAAFQMKGINLGNWLLWEGYLMMGDFGYLTHTQFLDKLQDAFGGNRQQALEFEHQWRLHYVDEQSIIQLKHLGFNSVRVPFHYNLFWDDAAATTRDHGFQYLDRLIGYCRTHGLYVLLDMHAAPGYQNPGDHCDNINSGSDHDNHRDTVRFWDDNHVAIAAQVWRHIANRYKDEPVIWGYDLINEPVPQDGREYELLPSLIAMRNAIREVDDKHIIVAEGSWWASDMQKLDWMDATVQQQTGVSARWDDKLVYQTHHYFAYDNPAAHLDSRKAIADKLNVPLMLGEYGENDMAAIRRMTDWCLKNAVPYFPWSFKKMYHDRCLWTITPDAGYQAVRDYMKNGGTRPANAYEAMIDFCNNRIGNAAAGLEFHADFFEAVRYTVSFDQWMLSHGVIDGDKNRIGDDPDRDGLSNAMEQFLGGLPTDPAKGGVVYQVDATSLPRRELRFTRSKSVRADSGAVHWSSNLEDWQPSGASFNGRTVILEETIADRSDIERDVVKVAATSDNQAGESLFLRIVVDPAKLMAPQ